LVQFFFPKVEKVPPKLLMKAAKLFETKKECKQSKQKMCQMSRWLRSNQPSMKRQTPKFYSSTKK
jgi:hypothetical protein